MDEEFSSGKTATFALSITSRVAVKAKGKRRIFCLKSGMSGRCPLMFVPSFLSASLLGPMELNRRADAKETNEQVRVSLMIVLQTSTFCFLTLAFCSTLTGKGTCHCPDGRFCAGERLDDRPHGQGTRGRSKSSDGAVLCDGQWAFTRS
jgi:hypothetical protein